MPVPDIENLGCAQCGKPILSGASSRDFCPECADKIRAELSLPFQIRHAWTLLKYHLSRAPIVTLALVVINVGIYLIVRDNRNPSFLGAMDLHWWRLLTGVFLHVRFEHLLWNSILLIVFGWTLERIIGHSKLLLLWITCGIVGQIAELVWRPQVIAMGASGVVFGLVSALVSVYSFRREMPDSKRRYGRALLLVLLVFYSFLAEWHDRGSFIPAHIGGLVVGFAFIFVTTVRQDGRSGSTPSD